MTDTNPTQQRILEAATQIFMERGYTGARMQAVADAAGINKAMLHYYFKNKDSLFQMILVEAMSKFIPRQMAVLMEEGPTVLEKMERQVEIFVPLLLENRHLPSFIMTEMQRNGDKLLSKLKKTFGAESILQSFMDQIEREVAEGKLRPFAPHDVYANTMSLMLFPFMSSPFLQSLYAMSDAQYEQFLENRAVSIRQYVRAALTP